MKKIQYKKGTKSLEISATNKKQFLDVAKGNIKSKNKSFSLNDPITFGQKPGSIGDKIGSVLNLGSSYPGQGYSITPITTAKETAIAYATGEVLGAVAKPIIKFASPYVKQAGKYLKNKILSTKVIPKVNLPVDKSKPNFKSEIDWAKWNKEIPENKSLMEEYNAIEQTSKNNGTWMKNPDGSAFQGTPEQFVQQNSQNFKNAFGNSKLVNPDGSPTIQYHGSAKKFDIFDESKFQLGDSGYSGRGIYTTPDKTTANSYATSSSKFHKGDIEPTVYELYGQANNPISSSQLIKENKGRDLFNFHRKKNWKGELTPEESLMGYDAAIADQLPNVENIRPWNDAREIVFPTNKQLKSAIGNNGMFDMTNPNIYKAIAPIGVGAAGANEVLKASKQKEIPKMKKGTKKLKYNNGVQKIYNDTPDYSKVDARKAKTTANDTLISGTFDGAGQSLMPFNPVAGTSLTVGNKVGQIGQSVIGDNTAGRTFNYGAKGAGAGLAVASSLGPMGMALAPAAVAGGAVLGAGYGLLTGNANDAKDRREKRKAERAVALTNANKKFSENSSTDAQSFLAKKGKYKVKPRIIESEGREPVFSPKKKDGSRDLLFYNPNLPNHSTGGVKMQVVPKKSYKYKTGSKSVSLYSEGSEHDLTLEQIKTLEKQGYKLQY